MELVAIRKATVGYFMRFELLNPMRKAVDRTFIRRLIERYGFLKYPQTYADFNNTADGGVLFADGHLLNEVLVEEVRIFPNGIVVSTGESTDKAGLIFTDITGLMLEVGLLYSPDLIQMVKYSSELVVRSKVDLVNVHAGITALTAQTFGGATGDAGFAAVSFYAEGDVSTNPVKIERIVNPSVPRDEFWSQAPLPTFTHLAFLTEYEKVLASPVSPSS